LNINKNSSNPRPVLIIILVSYLMIVLDISIVITALPKIHYGLKFSATGLAWVQNAYTLTFGGLLLLGARAGDILGRRRMFMIGLCIFTISSLAIGLAQSPLWLIFARAFQGVGAAILAPSTLSLLSTNFAEGHDRTQAIAYYGAVAGIGASAGLVLGGIIADWLSWRVGFFINLPIGIALLLGAKHYLSETKRHSGTFDMTGAVFSTIGMSALVYGIIRSANTSWNDRQTVMALVSGVILIALFIIKEWRAKQPIMPLRLFSNKERVGAYSARFLFLGAMMGFWFFTTQFLQIVMGFSPFEAGLAFLPMTLVNFTMAIAVPKFTRRIGNARLLAIGITVTMIGMAWLSRVSSDSYYWTAIALPMVLIGLGQGGSLSPLTVSGVAGVAPEDAGAASGLVNVSHQLGGSLGLSILVFVFATAGTGISDVRELLAHRISTSLTAGTGMLALALIITYIFIVRSNRAKMKSLQSDRQS
jgi:EmrB/QacA subfamily drug resistance transporter